MFNINLGEFGIIAVIAVIVIGPERMPQYAQQLGRLVREARKMAMGLREQVRDELGPDFDEVDWRKLDPRQYDPRRIIRDALSESWEDDASPSPATGPVDDLSADPLSETADFSATTTTGAAAGTRAVRTGATAAEGVSLRKAEPVPYDVEAT